MERRRRLSHGESAIWISAYESHRFISACPGCGLALKNPKGIAPGLGAIGWLCFVLVIVGSARLQPGLTLLIFYLYVWYFVSICKFFFLFFVCFFCILVFFYFFLRLFC